MSKSNNKFDQAIDPWFALSGERVRMRLEKLPDGAGRYEQKTAILERYHSLDSTWKVFLTGTGNTWEDAISNLVLPNTGLIGRGSEEPTGPR